MSKHVFINADGYFSFIVNDLKLKNWDPTLSEPPLNPLLEKGGDFSHPNSKFYLELTLK